MTPQRAATAILALLLTFFVVLAGMRALSLAAEREAALARAAMGMRSLAGIAERHAQRAFDGAGVVAEQVAARIAAQGGVAAIAGDHAFRAWVAALAARAGGDYVAVIDAAGMPVMASSDRPSAGPDVADRGWFRAHRAGAERLVVGEALHSPAVGEATLTFTQALHLPDGSFDGVVLIALRTGFFQQPDLAGEFGGGTVLGLFDAEGRMLALSGPTAQDAGGTAAGSAVAARLAEGATGGTLTTRLPGERDERIVAFRRLADWPLVAMASVPVADALAVWRRSLSWSLLLLGAAALALAVPGWLAMRLAAREAGARQALRSANAALRDAAGRLEARVAARTRELAAGERRFRAIFDSSFQLILLLDRDGTILEANEATRSFLGLDRSDLLGRRLETLGCWPDPATREAIAAAVATAASRAAQRQEATARAGNGRLATLDVSLRPVAGADDDVAWIVAEGHDLTEIKLAETRLREAQKAEALGQLTGAMAHDFNNLLMVVLGNLGLLRRRLPADPALLRLLDGAQQGAERGAALTARMLAFAGRQELRPVALDLGELLRGMLPLLERSAGPKVQLALTVTPGLPPALADAAQVELALLAIVVNARDAMPGGGRVEIGVTAGEAPSPSSPAGLTPGRYLRVTLSDSGAGMDAATLRRAAEPFFTTKRLGQASGLGLSMVQGLAQQSGGGLTLSSQPGAGTAVTIWLPRAEPAAPVRQARGTQAPPCTVLVVDDDPLVAAGTALLLEDLGHQAVVAGSAAEALTHLARGCPVDLVLTDHAMPGMSGLDLAERLRQERPDLPVALATGHAGPPIAAAHWLPRLAKPYRQEELDALIRRLAPAHAA